MAVKTEHAGAKNGGGFWGRRVVAKAVSKRLRRRQSRREIRDQQAERAMDPPFRALQDKG